MSKQFNKLALPHRAFIEAQHMFFVATAAPTGRVNNSPKGMDSLRVVDPNRIIWRNSTGSGNETAGHLRLTPRMTLMWCAFDAQPLILRCYGTARAIHIGEAGWDEGNALFPHDVAARQLFDVTIDLVQTSCGYSVPRMAYEGERPDADAWAAEKGPDGIVKYWGEVNRETIDGFPTGIEGKPVITADALAQLEAMADPETAAKAAAYHKFPRRYLGVHVPQVAALADEWRAAASLDQRVELAAALWDTDIHEARVAAAKLLTQARIRPDEAVWTLVQSWVSQFDAWAIADHACSAIERRLTADPSRIDTVEGWTTHPNMWTRRAALVATLPWTKQNHPKPEDLTIRDRVLGWAAGYADDRDWFIQKSIAWWLRELSKHDPTRTQAFLEAHGSRLKPFARKEAGKYL